MRLEHHEALLSALRVSKVQAPEQFSLVRGVMFLCVGILAIAGDITFLGGVLATLVGADLRDPLTQQTFARLAFSDPLLALERFPEVAVLTVSVLLVGFVVKVWHDAHRQYRRDGSDGAWYVIASVVSASGLLMLASVAFIRLQQPLETGDSQSARIVSTILGLVLPTFGTICVMTGMERLTPEFSWVDLTSCARDRPVIC
jgi:hypothetical protein